MKIRTNKRFSKELRALIYHVCSKKKKSPKFTTNGYAAKLGIPHQTLRSLIIKGEEKQKEWAAHLPKNKTEVNMLRMISEHYNENRDVAVKVNIQDGNGNWDSSVTGLKKAMAKLDGPMFQEDGAGSEAGNGIEDKLLDLIVDRLLERLVKRYGY